MRIEFDAAKNKRNIEERGLPFDLAAEFDFETAMVRSDTRKDYGEERFSAIGYIESRLYVVVYKVLDGGIRVISFRKANER